jgi:hypothetical protein
MAETEPKKPADQLVDEADDLERHNASSRSGPMRSPRSGSASAPIRMSPALRRPTAMHPVMMIPIGISCSADRTLW